jgi:hypothetical protein
MVRLKLLDFQPHGAAFGGIKDGFQNPLTQMTASKSRQIA